MAYNFPSNPALNQIYSYNGRSWKWTGVQWLAVSVPTSTSAPVYFSMVPPTDPLQGALWYDTLNETLKIWGYLSGNSTSQWIDITADIPSPEPPVIISSSPPMNPAFGSLWFDTISGNLKVYVDQMSGGVWENSSSSCSVTVSVSPPTDPASGTLWFNSVTNELKVWKESTLGGSNWVLLSHGGETNESPVLVSSTPPVNPLEGYLWYDTLGEFLKVWTVGPGGGSWIAISADEGRAPPSVLIYATEPSDPVNGSLWYNTTNNVLYLRDNSSPTQSWIALTEVVEDPSSCTKTTVSSSPPPNPNPGDFWFDAESSNLNLWYVDLDGGQWVSMTSYPQEMITVQGGVFEGPIYAGYTIPADPLTFVTVQWVQDYFSDHYLPFSLTEAPDVEPTGLTDKSTFVYNSSTSLWETGITILDITNGGTY